MNMYRAWLPDQPEPMDYPLLAPCSGMAASDLIRADKRTDPVEIERHPILVLVRDTKGALYRCLVSATTDVTIYGYPEDLA